MRRRDLIGLMGAAVVIDWPRRARSQQRRVPLIAIMFPVSEEAVRHILTGFRARLAELGRLDGRDYELVIRYTPPTNREAALRDGAELLALSPAVILTAANIPALAIHHLTSTVPVVFVVAGDPVGFGFAESFAHPGGNMTGVLLASDPAIVGKQLALLQELAPAIKRIDALAYPDDSTGQKVVADAAHKLNLSVRVVPVVRNADVVSVLGRDDLPDAFFFGYNPMFNTMREEIVALVRQRRRPAIYTQREIADAGGLMSYGASLPGIWRVVADYAGKILGGASPGDLPIEQPAIYELVINLKAAKDLRITVPPALLARADEVIE